MIIILKFFNLTFSNKYFQDLLDLYIYVHIIFQIMKIHER